MSNDSTTPSKGAQGREAGGISRREMLCLGPALPAVGAAGLVMTAPAEAGTPANVKTYGAQGDGVCDDTAALQRALDENPCVQLPPGTYRLSEPLEIGDYQVLDGCGSTLEGLGDHAAIRRRSGTQFVTGPAVRNLQLEGFDIALDVKGIQFGTFDNLHVRRSQVGFRLAISRFGYCYYNTFTGCHIQGELEEGVVTGVRFEGTDSVRFGGVRGANGNTFRGCKIGGEAVCLDIRAPVNNTAFYACAIERGLADISLLELGVQRYPDAAEEELLTEQILFSACRFEGGEGARLHVGPYARGCHFVGNVISGGVEVIDEGEFTNWFPFRKPGEHRIGFSLEPSRDPASRIGGRETLDRLFLTVNARTFQAAAPYDGYFNAFATHDQPEPVFRIADGGRLEWAPPGGTAPPDTKLYRAGSNSLRTDDRFTAATVHAGSISATDGTGGVPVQIRGSDHRLVLRDEAGRDSIVLDGRTGRITCRNGDCLG